MQLIKQEKFNKKISKEFDYGFELEKNGLYLIEITVSCKSWLQNLIKFVSFFKDDDLTVKIDNIEFPKLDGCRGLFDGEVAWNGNNLKGLKKTNVFLIYLTKGQHTIQFLVNQKPYLENIKIYSVKNQNFDLVDILKDNNPAEDGNRRQWLTIILTSLPLKNLFITTKAEKNKRDDDDIKLIINNKIQKNTESKAHKYWYWCGRTLKGNTKEFSLLKSDINTLPRGMHYIELWADGMPRLEKIIIDLGEKIDFRTKAKVVWGYTHLRKKPTTKSEAIFEKINKGEQVIVLEKAVKGERYRNEANDKLLSTNRWHKVEHQSQTGFIYSLALEVEREDKETIQKMIIEKSKNFELDPEILLVLAKCESEFFPYTVSHDKERSEIAFGVMQISGDLLNGLEDYFNLEQNIQRGVSYFNDQYNKKYKDDKDRLRKSVAAYNAGPGHVEVDERLELELYDPETQRIVSCVQSHLREKTFQKILSVIKKPTPVVLVAFLFLFICEGLSLSGMEKFSGVLPRYNLASIFYDNGLPKQYKDYRILEEKVLNIKFGDEDGRDDSLKKRLIVINNSKNWSSSVGLSKMILLREDGYFIELPGWGEGFRWWQTGYLNGNHRLDIAVMYENSGNGAYNPFYFYEWNGYNFEIKLQNDNFHNNNELIDLDGDGLMEVLHFVNLRKWSWSWPEIYKWNARKQEFVKSNHLFSEIYTEWLKDNQFDPSADPCVTAEGEMGDEFCAGWKEWRDWEALKKLGSCLTEKAILNSQGIFADVDDC